MMVKYTIKEEALEAPGAFLACPGVHLLPPGEKFAATS